MENRDVSYACVTAGTAYWHFEKPHKYPKALCHFYWVVGLNLRGDSRDGAFDFILMKKLFPSSLEFTPDCLKGSLMTHGNLDESVSLNYKHFHRWTWTNDEWDWDAKATAALIKQRRGRLEIKGRSKHFAGILLWDSWLHVWGEKLVECSKVGNHNALVESAPANRGFLRAKREHRELCGFKTTVDNWDHFWCTTSLQNVWRLNSFTLSLVSVCVCLFSSSSHSS